MNDEQFAEEFGRRTGMGPILASWYWFGGPSEEEMEKKAKSFGFSLTEYIDSIIGYKDDSDNPALFFQHLYDKGLLSWEAIEYISDGAHIPLDKEFLCIWVDLNAPYDEPPKIESHGLPFFSSDRGFEADVIERVNKLDPINNNMHIFDGVGQHMHVIRTY